MNLYRLLRDGHTLHMILRGVDKFVRVGGWDVVKCIYVDILLSKYNVKQYYYIG